MSQKSKKFSQVYDRILESELPQKTYSATNTLQAFLELVFKSASDRHPGAHDARFLADVKRHNLRAYGAYFVELTEEIESGSMKKLSQFEIGEDKHVSGLEDLIQTSNHNLQALRMLSRQRKQLCGTTLVRFTNSKGPLKVLRYMQVVQSTQQKMQDFLQSKGETELSERSNL
jgi:hypothetical protein